MKGYLLEISMGLNDKDARKLFEQLLNCSFGPTLSAKVSGFWRSVGLIHFFYVFKKAL
jgi:hypothetical protein